jgi:hypothetical protein
MPTYHAAVMGTVIRHVQVDAASVELAEMAAMKEWANLTGGEFTTSEVAGMWEEVSEKEIQL